MSPELAESVGPVMSELAPETPGFGQVGALARSNSYFCGELALVCTFVIPHHGSIRSYAPSAPFIKADHCVAAAQTVPVD